jgi:hypothetical protein
LKHSRPYFNSRLWVVTAAILVGQVTFAVEASTSIDDSRIAAAGIRKLQSRHLTLYTDVQSGPDVDGLPGLFDEAVPLWAEYFGVDSAKTADWRVRAFLIGDREKFAALGLLPEGRELAHGYAEATEIWVLDQTTDYYRRHLLLHEGTHAFMATFLGGCGPAWYSEGMAELLATHRQGARGEGRGAERGAAERGAAEKKSPDPFLELNIMPGDRREVPMLGRIKLVREAVAAGKAQSVDAILHIDGRRQLGPEVYAWCWALAKFLDSQPRYRDRFRGLATHVTDADFNDRVRREFADDWDELAAGWQAYVAALDHGYDFERMAIEFKRGAALGRKREVTVRADRGWQSSGVWLEAGKTYRVSARGRFQIATVNVAGVERLWPCEPGGVTIEYHDGRPLGMLLGAIVPDKIPAAGDFATGFARPAPIGLAAQLTPEVSGTLYLRVNESASRLGDNRGALTIVVEN